MNPLLTWREEFFRYLELEKNISSYTKTAYEQDLMEFEAFMQQEGWKHVEEVDPTLVRLYYSSMDGRHSSETRHISIGLASWRLDGFVSRRAEAEGEVLTRPFRCEGERLYVNGCARPQGTLRVEVQTVDPESDDQLNSTIVAEGYGKEDW